MGSTRLPGKVLADVVGKSLLERVVERARRAALVDEVVVLTSTENSDDPIEELCEARGITVRRGPLDDVLARYLALADEFQPDHIVRITGDCPLIEPSFIDLELGALRAFDADFVEAWPAPADGPHPHDRSGLEGTLAGAGAFSTRALLAARSCRDARDREHVASFFFQREAARFRFVDIEVDPDYDRPGLRLCVDEPEDLAFVRRVFERYGDTAFSTLEAIRWLDARPDVRGIHGNVRESDDNRACREEERRRRRTVASVGLYRRPVG